MNAKEPVQRESIRDILRQIQKTTDTFVEEGRADRIQAAEDRRKADLDRKLFIDVIQSLDRSHDALVALMGRQVRIQQSTDRTLASMMALLRRQVRLQEVNNLLLRRLVSNGRFGGNGSRPRRNRKES